MGGAREIYEEPATEVALCTGGQGDAALAERGYEGGVAGGRAFESVPHDVAILDEVLAKHPLGHGGRRKHCEDPRSFLVIEFDLTATAVKGVPRVHRGDCDERADVLDLQREGRAAYRLANAAFDHRGEHAGGGGDHAPR